MARPDMCAVPGATGYESGHTSPRHEDCGGTMRQLTSPQPGFSISGAAVTHSHLAIRHLIRQVDDYAARRQSGRKVPEWLTEFVQRAADLFVPFRGVARPGFECRRGEDRWEISIFLGKTEAVGGRRRRLPPVNFSYDIHGLSRAFEQLHALRWNAFPDCGGCTDDALDLSFLVAEGTVQGQLVSLQVHAGPPEGTGPALKRYDDGSFATV
ncbi:MAG: hypothetical protein U0992_03850 [Planctomycetaceae bacterium]